MKYDLPKSEATERTPFVMPATAKKIGIISDVHIPYHNIKALNICFDKFIEHEIDVILFNGDIIDCYRQSKFQPDPRKRDLNHELDATRMFLDTVAHVFPKCKLFYKMGNHEKRLERYLMIKAPELLGIPEFELRNLLQFGSRGITYIDDLTIIKAGALKIFHGHELGLKSVTVNPARTLFLRAQVSSLCAHLHVPSYHSEKRANGHIVGCWSIGHLGEESPDYAPYNKWQLGFAIVYLEGEEFEVSNYKIVKNKAYRT